GTNIFYITKMGGITETLPQEGQGDQEGEEETINQWKEWGLTSENAKFATTYTITSSVSDLPEIVVFNLDGTIEADEDTMTDYALIGLTAAVGDPYTSYYPKDEFDSYKDNVSASYVGIGATLGADMESNKLVVISPMEDSPAEKAGLKSGDIIETIDGTPYTAAQLSEAATYLKSGEEGTSVVLEVERDGKEIEITITRAKIVKISVKSKMLGNNIGYIRITGFERDIKGESKNTYEEFCEHLDALKTAGMTALVIDLRDNPGGDFELVCAIADKLLPEGLITYTEDKNGKREDIMSDKESLNMPMAVLINGGSASASEVLTGALKDNEKATVIGTKSYGKGIVQSVFSFTDGSGMSVTTAKYFTPSGVCIHGIGIEPDIEVAQDSKKAISELTLAEDAQLKKALETLSR
ncbi:MAG: S41 family peptidase, partial [Clostridia bacterium]|nr:S41 family peptidase [Clostridia bacterium]